MGEHLRGIRLYEERRRKIRKMNLTSDLFSSVVFKDIPAVQDVLRILTGIKDLVVTRVMPQKSMRNLFGHSSVLDVWAEDSRKTQYNLELQMAENEDHIRRTRFIQSVMDSRIFSEGEKYGDIPELYLIFITEKDFLETGTGLVEIVQTVKGTNSRVEDGIHKIFANLEYPAEDEEVDRLLRYIGTTNDPEIGTEGFENLFRRVMYLKEEEEGVRYMCEWAEWERSEGREEGRAEGREEERKKINLLNRHLAEDGRIGELIRSATDSEVQNKLLAEYGIV